MLPYPLKTSLEKGQLFGGIPCAVRAGFYVTFTRLRWCLSHLTLVAMIWSSVSLKFIIWNHRFRILLIECVCSCMTLSQRRTQMRWRDSERRIWRSLEAPLWLWKRWGGGFSLWVPRWGGSRGTWMELQPSKVPRSSWGHRLAAYGQSSLASCQIVWVGFRWQWRSI